MQKNKLIIAAAGSGKTTYLVKKACEIKNESVLITTYTEANEEEIKRKIVKHNGFIPSNVTIQAWFSFLLQHGVRPYQSILDQSIHDENIGFHLTNIKSAGKIDEYGKQIFSNGKPAYWGENDFKKHYFTKNLRIYSDKLSKFVVKCNEKSENAVIDRISRIFDHIFIDEVQDLAGYDLELIKLFFKSSSSVLLVGDPRQVTYLTNNSSKFRKYSDGKIKDFIENELGKKIKCDIDETSLNHSHRNNEFVCIYSARLYHLLSAPSPCACEKCRIDTANHAGVFIVKSNEIEQYLSIYNPVQLRWSVSVKCNNNFQSMNFGESKGLSFDRVLIYPTEDMKKWVKNNNFSLKNEARAKLYVGITRARYSVAILMDYDKQDIFDGITCWDCCRNNYIYTEL